MEKILVLLVSRTLAVSLAGCDSRRDSSQIVENSGKKVRIMTGYENNPGEPVNLAYRERKRLVEGRSGGVMRVELYLSNQLGSKDNIIDQVVNGGRVVTLTSGPFFQGRRVQSSGALSTSYLFGGWEDLDKVMNSDWFNGKAEELEQNAGLKILTTWRYGIRHTIIKKSVNAVSDLKSRKIRVPNQIILVKVPESLGVTPMPMAMSDIYTALQQGATDRAENPLPVILNNAYQEVTKNLVLDAHTYDMTCQIMEADYFHTLTEQQQNILTECGNQAGIFDSQQLEKADEEVLEVLKEAGVTVNELTPEDFKATGQAFYEDPQIKAIWSEGSIERMRVIIGRQD